MKSARDIAEAWLYSKIAAVTTNVHRAPAPRDVPYPLVALQLVGARDARKVGDPFAVEYLIYQIDVYDEGRDARPANALAQQVYEAIARVNAEAVEGGIVHHCIRDARNPIVPIDHEIHDNVIYQRNGTRYELMVQADRS